MIQARAPSIKSLPPRALAAEAQMARLFAGRSLRLSMEDAFRLPRGERSDPLLLDLVGRLPGAGVEHHLAVLLERLPLEDLGEEVRGVLVGRDVR